MSLRGRHFPLGDRIPIEYRKHLADSDCMVHRGFAAVSAYRVSYGNWHLKPDLHVTSVWTGEKRPPRKGEWYLSGAVVTAYLAPNDLSTPYHIARLVVARTTTTTKIELVLPRGLPEKL